MQNHSSSVQLENMRPTLVLNAPNGLVPMHGVKSPPDPIGFASIDTRTSKVWEALLNVNFRPQRLVVEVPKGDSYFTLAVCDIKVNKSSYLSKGTIPAELFSPDRNIPIFLGEMEAGSRLSVTMDCGVGTKRVKVRIEGETDE
jgi:hypothetical protein